MSDTTVVTPPSRDTAVELGDVQGVTLALSSTFERLGRLSKAAGTTVVEPTSHHGQWGQDEVSGTSTGDQARDNTAIDPAPLLVLKRSTHFEMSDTSPGDTSPGDTSPGTPRQETSPVRDAERLAVSR